MSAAVRWMSLAALVGLLASCTRLPATEKGASDVTFDVPRLTGITIDGDPADWGTKGLCVNALHDPALRPKPTADFDAVVRLGWDGRGLLVLVSVADPTPIEEASGDQLWRKDSVEFFVAAGVGKPDAWQAVIAPGLDPKCPEPRTFLADHRKSESLKHVSLRVEAARTKTKAGYCLEALLPWECLGIAAEVGREIGFQVQVNNAAGAGETAQLRWFPSPGAAQDTKRMHALRLAERPSPPVAAAASGGYERFRRTLVSVAATAGKLVRVRDGGRLLARGKLSADGRLRRASLELPMPPRGKPYGPLAVTIDGRRAATLDLPNADTLRRQAFERAELAFRPCVFSGEKLPDVEFSDSSLVEDLIGPYTLKTRFFDAGLTEVSVAEKPGRYGAIVEIVPEAGRATKRFFTLFRSPGNVNWWRIKLPVKLELPKALGIDPLVAREHAKALSDFVKWDMRSGLDHGSNAAILFAGLYETEPGTPATERTSPWARDTRWWHALQLRTGDLAPLKYLVHLPPGAEKSRTKRWPTILFLHGAGERGDNLKLVEVHGPPKIVKSRPDFPFIVISPQCPAGTWWNVPALDDLLNEVAAKYPVDPDRLYLTGLSMGGFGTWALATEYPERFAAIVPICGGGDDADVERLKDLPTWVFHGAKDPVVPLESSQEMADALRKIGGRVRFTVYPDAGHDSWTAAYESEELYAWLLQQRRGKPREPRVTDGQ